MALGPVLIGIDGLELTPESVEQLNHPLVGGVVLFSRNFEDRLQLESLVQSIRKARDPRLLIAVDQEGGRVQRFREGFTALPALGRIGALMREQPERAPDFAYWHGRLMASEMLETGIDLSFAPVLDLDRGSAVIGDRAFSGEVETVIELGRAYMAGMHDAGMKSTGKHFPGHGSVELDSHVADVCDERELAEIQATDLRPFDALKDQLDAMMIAHVVYPCVDDAPAGYSAAWLGSHLRDGMGYRGVIFSDDLGMHAAKALGNLAERARVSLEAGCDAVLVCRGNDVKSLFESWQDGFEIPDRTSPLSALYGSPGNVQKAGAREETFALQSWRERLESLG
jgi:beta-N-acetylhexosaminidase